MKLVLASTSQGRRALLERLGLKFDIIPPILREEALEGGSRSSKPYLHLSIYIVLDTVRFITVSAEPPTGAFLAPLGNPAVTNKLLELRSL